MMVEETFSALDFQFADLVGRLAARRSIELELAALLVSRHRTGGHICLPLHEIAGQPLPAVGSVATLELRRSLAIACAKLDHHRAEQTKNEAME
jgi:hypothetical protein